jgi:ankyrin repeat protein
VKGNAEIMRLLLNAGEANEALALRQQLTSPASFGRNPIMIAAANGKSECLRLLLEEYTLSSSSSSS